MVALYRQFFREHRGVQTTFPLDRYEAITDYTTTGTFDIPAYSILHFQFDEFIFIRHEINFR